MRLGCRTETEEQGVHYMFVCPDVCRRVPPGHREEH
jgi:hypothetical protein